MRDESRAVCTSIQTACRRERARRDMLALVGWTAGLGAITAEALAHKHEISLPRARGRLQAAVRAGLLTAARPLRDHPALYAVTSRGVTAASLDGLRPCRITVSNAAHLIACAAAAAGLERCYPNHTVCGEHELRRDEREHGQWLASAVLGRGHDGQPLLHRPDLVLWPEPAATAKLPVVVEVELTVKAAPRLQAICKAWARCQLVAGVLYLCAPAVERPLRRAIERTHADVRVVALPLEALPGPIANAVPSTA
jgi:hypothetical protein